VEEELLKKKLNSYNYESNDFQTENELTVEITLNEYRNLVKEKAISEYKIKKAEEDRYERNSENARLKEENKKLEMKVFEYRKQYGELKEEEKEEEE